MINCVYCGRPAEEIDHIVPLSLGGLDTPENRVPACVECNRHKHAKPPIVFLKELLEVNGLPFQYNDKNNEPEDKLKRYLIKEFVRDGFALRIYREKDSCWFNLIETRGSHTTCLLSGRLFALKLLGYDIHEFENDDISGLFLKLEIMRWLYRDLDESEIASLEHV
jgi:hypothetical protein